MDIKRHLLAFFPESPSFLGLNELTLKFTGEREEAYISQNMETFLSRKRLALMLGIAMFAIFALVDLVLAPKALGPLFFIRFGITAAILFFVLSLSYIDKVRPLFHKVIFGAILVMNLSHLIAFTKLPLDVLPKYHFSYLILIVYSSFMMATTFLNTAIAVIISVLFYIGYLSFSPALLTGDKLLFSLVALILAILVILVIYYAEYLSRRSYILESRLESRGEEAKPRPSSKHAKKLKKAGDKVGDVRDLASSKTEADIRAEIEKTYTLRLEGLKKELEIEKKNTSMLEQELEDLRLREYEKAQSREESFLKEKEALLKDKDGAYEDFKKGLLKDYETRLNQLQRDMEAGEEKRKELETLNKNLMADIDRAMAENKGLKDLEKVRIEEKSLDDIRLMGRMGAYASSSMIKNVVESLNYFDDNEAEFKSACSLRYINNTNSKLRENLYIAGAIKYRFDLFRLYLEDKREGEFKSDVSSSIQRSFSQLSRFFEGTGHFVDVTCKDGLFVRMGEESLDLIFQNLVLTSLSTAARAGENAHILISVSDQKSRVVIEYQDEAKNCLDYYKEVLKLKDVNSNIVSVSGLEIFFIRELIKRYTGGEVQIEAGNASNKLVMSFVK